ncbi:uncharacterized protein LOC131648056 [Vicia villosa]|uniref:uncharacterized protein LOC131648056 n=1 Tax=Vicia villosa TaxID=3911 RepID=UPI00273B59F7|nr:uncharacterized protein LOC131648056 [Vicia villosa]
MVQGIGVEGSKLKDSLWWRDVIANEVNTEASDEGFKSNIRLEDGYCWLPTVFMGSADVVDVVISSTVLANQWQQLMAMLDTVWSRDCVEDRFVWKLNSSCIFSVASISALCSRAKQCAWQPLTVRILKILWHLDLPLRIAIFAWRFFSSRLPTIDSLLARGVANIPNVCCVFCRVHPESLMHVFFDCQVSKNVWEWDYSWLCDEVLFSLQEFKEFLVVQEKVKKAKDRVKINFIWISLIWSLWIMRNSIIFEQASFSFELVVYNVMFLSWSWLARIRLSTSFSSFYEWYKLPLRCFENL